MKYMLLLFPLVLVFVSCRDKHKAIPEPIPPKMEDTPKPRPRIIPKEDTNPSDFEDARLETMSYNKGIFNFTYSGKTYLLGAQTAESDYYRCANSVKGQHIHLIIDDQPYLASYTADFALEVADGPHTILAFLSRSYHESLKNGKAHLAKRVIVKNGSFVSSETITEPMLFYSRPKGIYIGKTETDKILLDYFIINAKKAGQPVAILVKINNDINSLLRTWNPHMITGLPMGENTITISLVDKVGDPLYPNQKPIERKFTLEEDPLDNL